MVEVPYIKNVLYPPSTMKLFGEGWGEGRGIVIFGIESLPQEEVHRCKKTRSMSWMMMLQTWADH